MEMSHSTKYLVYARIFILRICINYLDRIAAVAIAPRGKQIIPTNHIRLEHRGPGIAVTVDICN